MINDTSYTVDQIRAYAKRIGVNWDLNHIWEQDTKLIKIENCWGKHNEPALVTYMINYVDHLRDKKELRQDIVMPLRQFDSFIKYHLLKPEPFILNAK